MRKGINGSTFPAGTSIAESARLARAAGFELFEPVMRGEGELHPAVAEAECRLLGEQIRAAGLEVSSLSCGLHWQTPLTSPDAAVRRQSMDLTVAALDRARWIGASVLLIVPGVVGRWNAGRPETRYEEALHHACKALHDLAFEAEARHVMIAVENVWNRFLLSPVEMRELIDRVNSAFVGVYLDVGNVLRFGYPQDWIESLGSRILRVHVRDYRLETGTADGFCLPGDGDVDWPAVRVALERIRYEGPLVYEGAGDLSEISRRLDRIMAG